MQIKSATYKSNYTQVTTIKMIYTAGAMKIFYELECGPMPNVMAALSNIGGTVCLTPQSLADAH